MLDTALFEALGSALLHSLWQGCVIGALAAAAFWALRGRSAQARYLVGVLMLAAIPFAFITTLVVLLRPLPGAGLVAPSESGAPSIMPRIAWVWFGGALLMSVRVLLQWRGVRRLRREARADVDPRWQREFAGIMRELGMRRGVRLLQSSLAEAPMVVGWVAPIVLMPVSAFTSLSCEQIRAVMVHELAHIRRFDHLVNALQSVVEIVLFFHPVVWWLSSRVRLEREHCCDDVAVRATGPVALARALSELETLRDAHPQMALAANGGTLMHRITRILGVRHGTGRRIMGWQSLAGMTAAVALGVVGMSHAVATIDTQPTHLTQSLRDAISVGAISEQKAREIYMVYLYPGSAMDDKIESHMSMMEVEIQAALDTGAITPEEARLKRDATRKKQAMAQDIAFAMDVKGLSHDEAYLGVMAVRIHEQLDRGEITREEATKKIHELKARDGHKVKLHGHLAKLHAEYEAEIEAGTLTKEQAKVRMQEHLREIESKLATEKEHASRASAPHQKLSEVAQADIETRRGLVLKAIEAEIAALLAEGKISATDAETRIEKLHDEWAHAVKKVRLDESLLDAAAALKEAAAAGEMSKAEAEAALLELMRRHEEKAKSAPRR